MVATNQSNPAANETSTDGAMILAAVTIQRSAIRLLCKDNVLRENNPNTLDFVLEGCIPQYIRLLY